MKHKIAFIASVLSLVCSVANSQTVELFADLNPFISSDPHNFVVFQGKLFFFGKDNFNLEALWETDGKSKPQIITSTGSIYLRSLTEFNNRLYFITNIANEDALWSSDGTSLGTKIVLKFNKALYPDYVSSSVFTFDNKFYFMANDSLGN